MSSRGVAVAMSGGVDSSVAALLLKRAGQGALKSPVIVISCDHYRLSRDGCVYDELG